MARELSAFGAHLSGYAIGTAIAWLPGTMLLGRMFGPAAVGLYSMGLKLVALPTAKISGVFALVFMPAVMQVAPEDRRRAYRATLRLLVSVDRPWRSACSLWETRSSRCCRIRGWVLAQRSRS